MRKVQSDANRQNPYYLKKIMGKYNIFESVKNFRNDEGMSCKRIAGTKLCRIKQKLASYAIGNHKGEPITGFDFVFVSNEAIGAENPMVEVITKDGESKFFDVNSLKIEESAGMGVGTLGGVSATGSVAPSTIASKTIDSFSGNDADAIHYDDKGIGEEILTPLKNNITFIGGKVSRRYPLKTKKRRRK